MRCQQLLSILPVLAAAIAPLSAQTIAPGADVAERITAADVARHIHVIADDSMMGRDTPSPGLEKTAQYIAGQFQHLGLKPGGQHGGWFQRYPLPHDKRHTAPNVIGILVGRDPTLKDEYLVFSAHMDHFGVGQAGQEHAPWSARLSVPDSIYNGVYDNASGVAGLIELAQAFSQPGARPRRSMLFLAVSGTERQPPSLWGSTYFVTHSPVPIPRIVADIDLNAIGRGGDPSRDQYLAAVGHEYSSLGVTLDSVIAAHAELDLRIGRVIGPAEWFLDSDPFRFAQCSIPSLGFSDNEYLPASWATDSPATIDTGKVIRVLHLVFHLGHAVGEADRRPTWTPVWYNQIFPYVQTFGRP